MTKPNPFFESLGLKSDLADVSYGPGMSVKIYESLDHLPTSYQELFDEVGQQDFFRSLEWFANLIETTSKVGEAARLYGLENEIGVPKALLITRWQTSAVSEVFRGPG